MNEQLSLDFTRRSDLLLLERALRRGFRVPDVVLQNGASVVANILASPEASNRDRLRAFSVLVAAEQVNVQLALKAIDKRFPDKIEVTDEKTPALMALAAELRNDHDYVEFQRQRALSCDTQSGAAGTDGHRGLPNGEARGALGPEADGPRAEEN